mgnify:CR=1 FL=1
MRIRVEESRANDYNDEVMPRKFVNAHQCERLKRDGTQCGNAAVPGRKWCKFHGGNAARGERCALFKHGRYSKELPTHLQERYEAALNDPDRLSMIAEIALVDAKTQDMLASAKNLAPLWDELQRLLVRAKTSIDPTDVLDEMTQVIDDGRLEIQRWQAVFEMIEVRRKLVETERKKEYDEHNALRLDQVMLLVSAIMDAVRTNVRNPGEQRAVGDALRLLVSGRSATGELA